APSRCSIGVLTVSGLTGADPRPHPLPHTPLRPAGHIRAEADGNAGLEELIEFDQTAAEKKIRAWTMSDTRLGAGDGRNFAGIEMNAMAKHGVRGQQSAFFVDGGVVVGR